MKKNLVLAASAMALMSAFASVAGAQPAVPEKPGHVDPAPGSRSNANSATRDALGHAVGVVSAEITTTATGFVGAAAMTDMYEIAAAQIAETRGQSKAVKTFAATMIKDHTKTTRELTGIVSGDSKLAAVIPATLDSRHQGLIESLKGAKDADFDDRYAEQQVDIHNEALIVMRGYHDKGDNAALKEFAGNVENAVKMHLSMAERLDKKADAAEKRAEK
jgi:putative membrane protein